MPFNTLTWKGVSSEREVFAPVFEESADPCSVDSSDGLVLMVVLYFTGLGWKLVLIFSGLMEDSGFI